MADIDLTQFDSISDRVARAKAKSKAMRNAKKDNQKITETPKESSETSFDEKTPANNTSSETKKSDFPILEFTLGLYFKWNGRAGRIVGIRYDLVSFVYDNDPDLTITADRYRLSLAHAKGEFQFAPRSPSYNPERIGSTGRIDYHEYLWLESRKGMTSKKRRPKILAIINPDYCTGCNACIEVCPTDCIEEVDVSDAGLDGIGHFDEVRLEDCIGCKQCVPMCPWEAIDMFGTDEVEAAYGIPSGTI